MTSERSSVAFFKAGRGQKEKRPWGSAQVIDKAQFGEENPRIFLGFIWPGFAGWGADLAQFGSGLGRTST
jgi:hypothetical protein